MDKFQIAEVTEQFNHAGTKATADIAHIADKLGFTRLNLCMRTSKEGYVAKLHRQIGYCIDWNCCYEKICQNAVLLLQHPFHYPQLTRERILYKLKAIKHVKIISVVHDVEELRAFRYNDYYKREFDVMIKLADVLIVHNEEMRKFFIGRGISQDKLINLEIFDYLQESDAKKDITFEKSITIAGNLDTSKCKYIGELGNLLGITVNLYGSNFDAEMRKYTNVFYHGSFPVDEIPAKLNRGFGLVWDGESIMDCKGLSGQYLKYNNPHKLSLYLSSGIPVIIWKQAAEADFVKKYNVGICVDNLYELDQIMSKMTEEYYYLMCKNVRILKYKLVNGLFSEKAIKQALDKVIGGN